MRSGDRRRMHVNRLKWDESVPLHVAAPSYHVPAFLRGRSTLLPAEVRELGPVRDQAVLHLQCHFGLDTLSWARRGARVTGVDFSLPAIRAARRLARRARISARFVHSNVYDLPWSLDGQFDAVYTGKGALWWLPDIPRWAGVVARCLRPGGRLYFLEDHPLAETFQNELDGSGLEPSFPYFSTHGRREEFDGTYATSARMRHRVTYGWLHPVSQVLTALSGHGSRIGAVREYPFTYWRRFPSMREDRQGYWHLTTNEGHVPLMWSVTARREPLTQTPPVSV